MSDSEESYYDSEEEQYSDHSYQAYAPKRKSASAHAGGHFKPMVENTTTVKFTKKVPPLFDGIMPWFTFEDLLDDWTEITDEEPKKWGVLMKQRLVKEAEHYKALLDNSKLKDPENGLKYLKDTLRPYYVKGAQQVFLYRFLGLIGMKRPRGMDMLTWIPKVQVKKKRALASWMDCAPLAETIQNEKYNNWVLEKNKRIATDTAPAGTGDATQEPPGEADEAGNPPAHAEESQENIMLDREDQSTLTAYNDEVKAAHAARFPLSENILAFIFIVSSELDETQRERLNASLVSKEIGIENYNPALIEGLFRELFAAHKTGFADPFTQRKHRHKKRAYTILDSGDWDGSVGYWVQDQETLDEGFYDIEEEVFWAYDEEQDCWFSKKGGKLRRGKHKSRKGKGRKKGGKPFQGKFKSHTKGKKGKGYYGDEDTQAADYGKGGKKGKPFGKGKEKGKDFEKGEYKGGKPGKGKANAAETQTPVPDGTPSPAPADAASWDPNAYWKENQYYDAQWASNDWSAWNDGVYLTYQTKWEKPYPETYPFALIAGELEATPQVYIQEVTNWRWEELQSSALNSYVDRWYRVDMRKFPTYVILDSGCTRNMGSMERVLEFIRFCEANCSWISFEWKYEPVRFSFANSHSKWVYWTLVVHYSLDRPFALEISVLEEGNVPVLLSNKQMGVLHLDLINREECTFINCPCLGLYRSPAEISTSNHQVVDLAGMVKAPEISASAELVKNLEATQGLSADSWFGSAEPSTILRRFCARDAYKLEMKKKKT